MILNQGTTGELWAETSSGGKIHLGTFHMDRNVFEESSEDGIVYSVHDILDMDEEITVRGTWKLQRREFETFRIRWLNSKFPSIDWFGGRALSGLPDGITLGPDKRGDGSRDFG